MSYKRKHFIILGILFVLSIFIRLYRLNDYTEFMGDQGSAASVIYESWQTKTIPLLGPAVSTGQYPGPLFYYLIAPFLILSNFHPLATALAMSIIGGFSVCILYVISNIFFGTGIALGLSILWSLSPKILIMDQTFWNPNPIPFLIIVLIAIFIRFSKKPIFPLAILIGIVNGFILQLHYTNIITHVVSIGFIFAVTSRKESSRLKVLFVSIFGFIFGWMIAEMPFIIYELSHNFENTRNVLLLTLSPPNSQPANFVPLQKASLLDLSTRLFWNAIDMPNPVFRIVVQAVLLIFPLFYGGIWLRFFVFWYIFGLVCLYIYKGPIPDHYLNFIFPFPFFFLGSVLKALKYRYKEIILTFIFFLLIFSQIKRYFDLRQPRYDIQRTQEMVKRMIELSNNNPFSFTPMKTRSFSDYHYRFFFEKYGIVPADIRKKNYSTLFLTCEYPECPNKFQIMDISEVKVICFDMVCQNNYPTLNMSDWKFEYLEEIQNGVLYKYQKKYSRRY